jgi:hypothetical protein
MQRDFLASLEKGMKQMMEERTKGQDDGKTVHI